MQGIYRRLFRSPGSSLAALGVVLSVATIVLFLTDLQIRYWDRIAVAKTDAQSFAIVLAEYTALTFEDVDRVLREAEAIRRNSTPGRDAGSGTANAALRQLQKSSSVLVAVGWTDAEGRLLAHSYDHAPPRSDISGMPHFVARRDNVDDRLFIAPPYRSATGNKWFTAASRRLNNSDGSFAGIVTAPIDQSYFTQLYRSINLGSNGSVLLLHRDGQLLAREPTLDSAIGQSYARGPLIAEHLPRSETGSYETVSVVDGVPRVAGYKAVRGLPLVVLVSFARADVLAPWYRHIYTFGPVVVAVVSIILLGTYLLVQQTNALNAKTRLLARTNARFDAALSNMPNGISMFDANERLLVSNSRYRAMYDLTEDQVKPGTPLNQIVRGYKTEGTDFNLNKFAKGAKDRAPHILTLADGRIIKILRTPMKDGGWVATHEDITEKRRAEAQLVENVDKLKHANDRFDAAISNMSQGLCLFDADKRLVISNSRYQEMYSLPDELVRPGTPLKRILQHYVERGETSIMPVDHYVQLLPTEREQNYAPADGRKIFIQRKSLPDGGWVATHEDITERARNEERIAFLAQHDLLTGLANRALFSEKLDEATKRLQRHGTPFTVLMLDLDKFKNVNDTLGHPAGDQLLVELGQRLRSSLRDTDVLARLGGDEFAIIQENEKNQSEGAIALALRIIGLIEKPFDLNGNKAGVGTSIGIAFAPEHGTDAEALLQKADLALYAAKSGGRNDFRIFQPELTEAADIQKSMESELREAVSRDEFELYYQPIIDMRRHRICGVEAFVRWHHPLRGLLAPEQFLPLAESTGLMAPLGEWILQQACIDAAAWPCNIRIAVNVSAVQFNKGNLFDIVLCALVDSGLSPERLELEITNTSLLEKSQTAHLQTIRQLKNIGISMVLDNCGAGYASAASLTGFPFDKIKIDRSLTQGFASRRDCAAVVASVLALAHGLDIMTAAKGVECREQFDALLAAGIDFAQGYLLGRPVPHSELDLDGLLPLTQNVA